MEGEPGRRTFLKAGRGPWTWRRTMERYVCDICGYIYDPAKGDPDSGIAPGTAFADIPDDWVCPECGAGKDQFTAIED